MARPRSFIGENGKPTRQATGVSINRYTGRFYIIGDGGQRSYFRTWAEARAAHVAAEHERMTDEQQAAVDARMAMRSAALQDKLREAGQITEADNLLFENVGTRILLEGRAAVADFAERLDRRADAAGVRDYRIADGIIRPSERANGSGPKLSAVLRDWADGKAADGVGEQHRRETETRFKEFVAATKDKRVADLTPADFRGHYDKLQREAAKRGNPARWMVERAKAIKGVITYVRRRHPSPEWPWPAGVTEWADAFTRRPVRSDRKNREPLPAEEFRKLLATCDAWAAIDVDALPKDTQADKAVRHHAMNRRRNGYQLAAMLRLACNCALSNVDLTRARWANLKLDADTPHLDLPRLRTENSVGAIERLIPLLAETVEVLTTWRAVEGVRDGYVFRTRQGTPMKPDRLADAFARLRKAAGVASDWQFKHLRNIAPSVGKRAKRPADERETILGHRCAGTRAFYEGDTDASYLMPLVELVEQHYFGG
jgi:integrase